MVSHLPFYATSHSISPRENVLPLVKRHDNPNVDLSGAFTQNFRSQKDAEECFQAALVAGQVHKLDG
jgi:hypothetical protein